MIFNTIFPGPAPVNTTVRSAEEETTPPRNAANAPVVDPTTAETQKNPQNEAGRSTASPAKVSEFL